jgi:hypothetical protein
MIPERSMLKQLIEQHKAALVMGAIALTSLVIVGTESPRALIVLVGGLVCVALLVGAYLLLQKALKRRKDRQIDDTIRQSSRQPAGSADRQAELESLQRKFDSGIQTLESLGLSMNALPWIAIVGEPASGKSEAIRRCKIPFPQGLTDELQGTGGTVNMDWWFTEHAIILDTAGKMLFEDVGQAESSEWIRFLELIRKVRPRCPINGMLLVIPADSLLADSDEKIEDNARKIARQLTQIQRKLSVRFPVYVVITKSDLIAGFREFFGSLDDRVHQQMLGWSSPDPLDESFDPEKLDCALADIRDRLEHHRFDLLRDPVHTEDPAGRRLAEVDRLYDFPSAVEATGPRIRRYLEIVFAGGKLAPKSLFFRGIYFTSSIQKGSALDAVLAESLGLSVDQIKEAAPFERVRPLFLRDLFMDKVFEETGLVTHVDNTDKLKTRRRTILLGAGAAFVALFFALAGVQYMGFRSAMGAPRDAWQGVAAGIDQQDIQPLVQTLGGATYHSGIDDLSKTKALAEGEITVPLTLRIASGFQDDLRSKQMDAYRSLLVWAAVKPAVKAADAELKSDARSLDHRAAAAAQLLRLNTLSRGRTPRVDEATDAPGLLDLAPLYRLALPDDEYYKDFERDSDRLSELMLNAFPPGDSSLKRFASIALGSGELVSDPAKIAGIFAKEPGDDLSTVYGCVDSLDTAVADFAKADAGLQAAYPAEETDEARADQPRHLDALTKAAARIDKALTALDTRGVPSATASALPAEADRDNRARGTLLLDQLPALAAGDSDHHELAKARDELKKHFSESSAFASLRETEAGGSAGWYLDFAGRGGETRYYSGISRMYAGAGAVGDVVFPPVREVTFDSFLRSLLERGKKADDAVETINTIRRDSQTSGFATKLNAALDASKRMATRTAEELPVDVLVAAMRIQVDGGRSEELASEIERVIADFAANGRDPAQFPTIPGTSLHGDARATIDWGFHPAGVGPLARHCWRQLIVEARPDAGASLDDYAEARRRLAAAIAAFGDAYIKYWGDEVPAMASVAFPRTDGQSRWDAVRARLGAIDVEATLSALDQLRQQMDEARAALPPTFRDRLPATFLDRAQIDARTIAAIESSLKHWHNLGSAIDAREALIGLRPVDLAARAHGGLSAESLAHLVYWNSLFTGIFEELAGQLRDDVEAARHKVEKEFARFPLTQPGRGDADGLTLDQLEAAREPLALAVLAGAASAPTTGVERIDEAIKLIYDPASEGASRYEKMNKIADALARGAMSVQIFRLDKNSQQAPAGFLTTEPAFRKWRDINIIIPGATTAHGRNARPERDETLAGPYSLKYQASPMTMTLSSGEQQIEIPPLAGPWAEIRLLTLAGVETGYKSEALGFDNAYRVPLRFQDDARVEYFYWIGLRLTVNGQPADLPEPGEWPAPPSPSALSP